MQIGRFLRRNITDPIRDAGRGVRQIGQGNVRQGLRDLGGITKLAAAFVPGGAMAAGAMGALGGLMSADRKASLGDFAKGAGAGALQGLGGRATRMGAQRGAGAIQDMFTGGGGAGSMGTGAAGAPSLPVAPGSGVQFAGERLAAGDLPGMSAPSLPFTERIASGGSSGGPNMFSRAASGAGNIASRAGDIASRTGGYLKDNPEVASGLARGAATAYSGNQAAGVEREALQLQRDRFDEEKRMREQEDERRRRIAELLMPMFQQMQSRQFGQ
jgi:hypothetical protein